MSAIESSRAWTLALALGTAAAAAPGPSPSPSPAGPPSSAGGAGAPGYAPDVTLERPSWSVEVDGPHPVRGLQVRNDYGDIRARRAGLRAIDVSSVIQRLGQSGVGFTVERRGEWLVLNVGYPPGRVQDSDPQPRKDSFDRLDLVVFVPEGVALEAQTARGMIEVRGLRSDVRAATLDGDILAITSGALSARSLSGRITALPGTPGGGEPMVLATRSGAISLTLEGEARAELRLETGGSLNSDFPLRRPRGAPGRSEALLNGGGRLIVLASETGAVELRRAPR